MQVTPFVIIALSNGLPTLSARLLVVKEAVSAQAVAWTVTLCFVPILTLIPASPSLVPYLNILK